MASPGRGLTLSGQVLGKNHRFRLALHSADQENGECQLINGLLLGRSIEVTVEALFEVICSQKICNSGPAALSDCLCHGYLRRFSLKASFAAAAARVGHERVAICLQLTKALPGSPSNPPYSCHYPLGEGKKWWLLGGCLALKSACPRVPLCIVQALEPQTGPSHCSVTATPCSFVCLSGKEGGCSHLAWCMLGAALLSGQQLSKRLSSLLWPVAVTRLTSK